MNIQIGFMDNLYTYKRSVSSSVLHRDKRTKIYIILILYKHTHSVEIP